MSSLSTLCISISARPGRLGTILHNAAYRALGLNFFYQAIGVTDLEGAIRGVRALNIRGCSVSMPFKEKVLFLLDDLDPQARELGAVNTIVNRDGRLTGYNTDLNGAEAAFEQLQVQANETVLILGAGGVARPILLALRNRGVRHVRIATRNPNAVATAGALAQWGGEPIAWEKRLDTPCDLLINATPIGMAPQSEQMPIPSDFLKSVRKVFDVVATPAISRLVTEARQQELPTCDGLTMSLHQAAAQFTLYTGQPAPFAVMKEAAISLLQ